MSKIKGHPGLFRPDYVGHDGKKHESRTIWGDWWCKRCPKHADGGRHREGLDTQSIKQAIVNLAKMKAQPKKPMIDAEELTVAWLLDRYLNYAITYCKRSTSREYEDIVRVHLRPALGFYKAVDLIYDSSILERFVASKQRRE